MIIWSFKLIATSQCDDTHSAPGMLNSRHWVAAITSAFDEYNHLLTMFLTNCRSRYCVLFQSTAILLGPVDIVAMQVALDRGKVK